MAKIDIKKTELIWKGKYDDEGRLVPVDKPGPYPFQIVEVINEPRIGHQEELKTGSLFDTWKGDEGSTFEEGWKNKLIWGDNKFVMSSLLEKFAGKIDLIYIDPPFATGADFRMDIEIGEKGEEIFKEHSIIEEKAYRDTWGEGIDSYLNMIYDRFLLMKDLLSGKGTIYVHVDHHVGQYIKIIMDEVFGADNFLNEIIWNYTSRTQRHLKTFSSKHDNIFLYRKNPNIDFTFNVIFDPYSNDYIEEHFKHIDENGRRYCLSDGGRGKPRYRRYLDEEPGKAISDVWDIKHIHNWSIEYSTINYSTQKPEALLDRIIKASSNEGDLVADFFCGSGTTLAVAEKLNRRWIGVDLGRFAIHTTRKRLLEIENSKDLLNEGKKYGKKARPFEILNLGKYERQFWQVSAFGRKDEKKALFEYLAFILKLYGAEPISGSTHIHGKKGNALVYIGAVDSPVTIQEVQDALNDTKAFGLKELHVLGWEWEMGLNDAIQEVVKQLGLRLKLRIIPMDVLDPQAVAKGDIRFFELAYFNADIETKGKTVKVNLDNFVIPHTDLIPPEVKNSIKNWKDWIDYWAVDFDFQNDTFNNGWTSYRTKSNRKLKLSADHTYEKAGNYKIFIKIIDIFGIDTSQIFEVKVK